MRPFQRYPLILATTVTAAILTLHHSGLVEGGKSSAGPAYTLTNLVPLPGTPHSGQARGITNPDTSSGVVHVAGFSRAADGEHVCVWSVSQTGADLATIDLGAPASADSMSVINNFGVVAGSDPSLPTAFVDFPGTGAGTGMYPLPLSGVAGAFDYQVAAVNDPGVDGSFSIVGTVGSSDGSYHGLLWDVSGPDTNGIHTLFAPIDLGTFLPAAINDFGVMVGVVPFGLAGHPTVGLPAMATLDHGVAPLSVIAGDTEGSALGINNLGDVVGYSGFHAIVWSQASGWTPVALKGFGSNTPPNVAYDINEQGQVVGYAYTSWPPTKSTLMIGVLWENGAVYDLNALAGVATTGKQRHVAWATAINDIGQISAVMSADFRVDDSLPAVLTPKP